MTRPLCPLPRDLQMASPSSAPPPAFIIAAARKSSGKTTLSLGLTRAFSNRGLHVQTYKKGPDYIDPLWLKHASHRPCYNLDFNTQSEIEILATYTRYLDDADMAIVETNKGLFDGLDLHGRDSNAQLAKILKAPLILVIDTIGMTRGIAPLLQGYASFDPDIQISGVILNKTGSSRHEAKLIAAVEHYTDIPVLGALARNDNLAVTERHLGLTTPDEKSGADPLIESLANAVEATLDLDKIQTIAAHTQPLPPPHPDLQIKKSSTRLTIAIARDAAFGFYYEDDLEAFKKAGAKLVFFSPLHDKQLPAADGLFIGGGFPETHMNALEANTAMRQQIKSAIENGLPTYAECGGLMYLSRSIHWRGKSANMAGVIPGDCHMHDKPQGRGFAILESTAEHPWLSAGKQIKTHEFHYSDITNLPPQTRYAYKLTRGHGIDGKNDGIITNNLLANFCHFRNTEGSCWVEGFLRFVSRN